MPWSAGSVASPVLRSTPTKAPPAPSSSSFTITSWESYPAFWANTLGITRRLSAYAYNVCSFVIKELNENKLVTCMPSLALPFTSSMNFFSAVCAATS